MKFTKYISANIISLLGNIGFLIVLINWNFVENYCGEYAFILVFFILVLLIEILIRLILNNKFAIYIPIKDDVLISIYFVLFSFGFTCSILYVLAYFYFVSKLIGK